MKYYYVFFSMYLFVSLCCSSDKKNENPAAPQTQDTLINRTECADDAVISFGEFVASNNVWGKGSITDYSQCIQFIKNDTSNFWGWSWNWPNNTQGNVKAYPEIIYGWKPFSASSTTTKLPVVLSSKPSVKISWKKITTEMNGTGNLAFDIWITNSAAPNSSNITREIMIWLQNSGQQPGGSFVTNATIDNKQYAFYKADWNWTYLAFVKTTKELVYEIKLDSVLQYLVDNKYISSTEYLSAVEFGNEIVSGSGKTAIEKYSIEIQ